MTTIYLAGSRNDIQRVQRWQAACRDVLGLSVTYDWTKEITAPFDSDMVAGEAVRIASSERISVIFADYVWLLMPETSGTGCFVELGMALGISGIDDPDLDLDPPKVLVSGSAWRRTIFTSLVDICADTDEEMFDWLTERVKGNGGR